jgi:hypothetical protein
MMNEKASKDGGLLIWRKSEFDGGWRHVMSEKVVPIWMGAVEAAVELLWENRVEGDDLEASWELLEPYGPEAIKKAKELWGEKLLGVASSKNSGARIEELKRIEEPKRSVDLRQQFNARVAMISPR